MTIFSLGVSLLGASSSKASTSGSSAASLLFIAVIFGALYFFFIRPRSQAARKQRTTLMELSPGDEVLTGAGIFGRVLDVEADRVTLETAPGTRVTVLRSTIARRLTEDPEAGHDDGEGHEDWDHENWDHEGSDHEDGDHEGTDQERSGRDDSAEHGDNAEDHKEGDGSHDWGTKDGEDHDPDGAPSQGGTGKE